MQCPMGKDACERMEKWCRAAGKVQRAKRSGEREAEYFNYFTL